MLKLLIRLFSRASRMLNLDLLWRISQHLSPDDRAYLTLRLMQKHDVAELTFKRQETLWTVYGWDTSISWSLLAHGHFQGEQIGALLSWMKSHSRLNEERRLIIDAGANIGTSTIPFAQKTDCHILAVEPFPDNFHLLCINVKQNGLDHCVSCVQKAVYHAARQIDMRLPEGQCGGARIVPHVSTKSSKAPGPLEANAGGQAASAAGANAAQERTVTVSCDGLDNILSETRFRPHQVAFVWCDIEGAESELIKTGTSLWQAGVPLYMEIYPGALKKQGGLDEVISLLNNWFREYIGIDDLMRSGDSAARQPIAEISKLVEELEAGDTLTDVLLLP